MVEWVLIKLLKGWRGTVNKRKEEFLECEKLWIFVLMIVVGGFLGAYTFVLKGGVFCNARRRIS